MKNIDKKAELQKAAADRNNSLLRIENLEVEFHTVEGVHKAVRNVSYEVKEGETLGVVGESGSGKSVTALSVMQLIQSPPGKIAGGKILFGEKDLLSLSKEEMNHVRGNEIAMIFQEPMTSLNPIHTCGKQIMEPLILHKGCSKSDAYEKALQMMGQVGIPIPQQRMKEYPHQLSGGMRQRVMIAMALVCQPKLLIADEPTTALDVTIQAQILELMKELRKKINSSIIMITHDLGVVAEMCDRVVVMYDGQIVEVCKVSDLFSHPYHPYSEGLICSIPSIGNARKKLYAIRGTVPSPYEAREGCSFAPRCQYADDICRKQCPEMTDIGNGRLVRCWHYEETGNVMETAKEPEEGREKA